MEATTIRPKGEMKTIGLVSFAHLLSHFYMLSLPPLFIYVRDDLNVSFVSLGLCVTAYAVTTGLMQTPMGFLVNRIGGGKVLAGGLFLNAAAIACVGFTTEFWQIIALMFVAGIGSSVFHPADYSILGSRVSPDRLGRALATHALGGNLGFVLAPPIVVALAAMFGWRNALLIVGGFGVLLAVGLAFQMSAIGHQKGAEKKQDSWSKLVRSPAILLLFVFYTLSAAANSGIVHFSVSAFSEIYGVPVATAAFALTTYQVLGMLAVLPGGWLADKFENHDVVLAVCMVGSAGFLLLCGSGALPFVAVLGAIGVSGAFHGLVNASRDISVRGAAKDVSVGTVFAFVTTGYSAGQVLGPTVYGMILDYGRPQLVFVASAVFSLLAILTMFARRSATAAPAPAE
jgi:FSR family fosmidomycin resistance protein-like MFS transporter